ncbi:hypothetical protein DC345_12525 [Paenibacillus taichungensis]|uniref:Uncharacterized protein n=1 Tax=Paenibacillus taichungensis TaxID=484184 RepID=A0A329QT09_9BACL|nr:hypothetical protein [Paenibacillus taichungensis]RAW15514.1 hypothetical protein DC345_12525 [Paenibacillus taichungensis]
MKLTKWRITYETETNPITGENQEYAKIPTDDDTVINVESAKEIQARRRYLKVQAYRDKGRRTEPFTQTMPAYENKVVGKYSPEMLECLFRTLPYMNYNSDKDTNSDKLIKMNGIPLNDTTLAQLWGVSRSTATKYIKQFVLDGIWGRKKPEGLTGNAYRFEKEVFLRGAKNKKAPFTKKIVLVKLKDIIDKADRERARIINHPYNKEEREYSKQLTSFHPIALLGAILIKTDYKSYFLLNNSPGDVIVKSDETVLEVLNSTFKSRRFKFLKVYQMWNLYSKAKSNKLSGKQKMELNACLYVLKRVKALGVWDTGTRPYYIVNPSLIYVSPHIKCDNHWYSFIESLFNLAEN